MPQFGTPVTCTESLVGSHTPQVYSSQSSHCNVSKMSIRSCHSNQNPLFTSCVTQNSISNPTVAWEALLVLPPNSTPPLTPCPVFCAFFPSSSLPALQLGSAKHVLRQGPGTAWLALSHIMAPWHYRVRAACLKQVSTHIHRARQFPVLLSCLSSHHLFPLGMFCSFCLLFLH